MKRKRGIAPLVREVTRDCDEHLCHGIRRREKRLSYKAYSPLKKGIIFVGTGSSAALVVVFSIVYLISFGASCKKSATIDSYFVTKPQHDIPWPSLANSPWPAARHDMQRTARSPYQGPQLGRIKWLLQTGAIDGSAAIGSDGTIYFPSNYKDGFYLYAVAPDGTVKWKFPTSSEMENSPLIAADGTIYVGSADSMMYALNPDGTTKWKFKADSHIYLDGAALGLDGTLYFSSIKGTLYALAPDGSKKWERFVDAGFYGGTGFCTAMSPDGQMLYVTSLLQLYESYSYCAISTSGELKWKIPLDGCPVAGAIVDNDGYLYFTTGNSFYSVNGKTGDVRWRFTITTSPYPGADYVGPVMDYNGCVYFLTFLTGPGESGYRLYSLDYAGNLRWSVPVSGDYYVTSLVCDKDNTVYLAPWRGDTLYAVTDRGEVKWKTCVGPGANNCPPIGSDGTLYLTFTSISLGGSQTGGRKLLAIQ